MGHAIFFLFAAMDTTWLTNIPPHSDRSRRSRGYRFARYSEQSRQADQENQLEHPIDACADYNLSQSGQMRTDRREHGTPVRRPACGKAPREHRDLVTDGHLPMLSTAQ